MSKTYTATSPPREGEPVRTFRVSQLVSQLGSQLVSQLIRYAQSTTKDYIRVEGDFHKEIVERTNKAEIRPEVQSEEAKSCWENLWNETQLKEP